MAEGTFRTSERSSRTHRSPMVYAGLRRRVTAPSGRQLIRRERLDACFIHTAAKGHVRFQELYRWQVDQYLKLGQCQRPGRVDDSGADAVKG